MTEIEPEDILELDDPLIAPTSGNPPKRHKMLTSKVWEPFDMLDELDTNGKLQVKCKQCGAKYCGESRHITGNMIRHLKTCKGKTVRDIGQYFIHNNVSGSMESRLPKFDADEFRELLAIAIVKHNLCLQLAEYDGIRACFSYLCPEVKFFSRSYTSGVEKELDDLGIMSDEDDFEDPAFLFDDDYQLLRFGYGWRGISHDASQPQMHRISVAKSDCKRSDFVHLLKKIGCEERFVACSIESPHAFFAELTEDEAAELEGVKGILDVSSLLWMIRRH